MLPEMRAAFAFGLTALVVVACKGGSGTPGKATPGTCSSDDECTFSCQKKGECCRNPYCETPALASEARAADAYNQDHCKKADFERCPQVGSRMQVDYRLELHCRGGACVADKLPLARDGGGSP